jgi:hypothetical protein
VTLQRRPCLTSVTARPVFALGSKRGGTPLPGAGLLVSGFLLQLVGYAWVFSSWWLLAYSIGLAAAVTVLAWLVVKRSESRFYTRAAELMRKAVE